MKFVALVSGGKDSCYAMHLATQDGHELVALANLTPPATRSEKSPEMDSYMYQTVGQNVIPLYSQALGNMPLFQQEITGLPVRQDMSYDHSVEGDEVEDLYVLLKRIQSEIPFDAISCGAIHSNYQRLRVENVCERLNIRVLSPLWGREQGSLLQEMIDSGIDAILIKVAAIGLDPNKHLGLRLPQVIDHLHFLHQKYAINVCGEGGEYESLTLDCPLFVKRIVVDQFEIVVHSDDAWAPVGYLRPIAMHLEDKQ